MAAKPNFFIVGAPECGTTTLYEYLRLHPNIFMPQVKEPHFFGGDLGAYPLVKTLDDYRRLFAESTEEHTRVGEASVYYRGMNLPATCRAPFPVQYSEVCQFGTQVQYLLSVFPRDQVKLIVFDDFAASPRAVYDEVIEFLGIPHDHRTDFPRINDNKRAQMSWLRESMLKPPARHPPGSPSCREVGRRWRGPTPVPSGGAA